MPNKPRARAVSVLVATLFCVLPFLFAAVPADLDALLRYWRDDYWKDGWPPQIIVKFPRADVLGPVPKLEVFNDFEDPNWETEVFAIDRQSREQNLSGRYKSMLLVNAALSGNALAAYELGDRKSAGTDLPPEFASLLEPNQWIDHTDALTSSGWWHLHKNALVYLHQQEGSYDHYQVAVRQGHPVAMYAMAKNSRNYFRYADKEYPDKPDVADLAHESARRGFAIAQSKLATVYLSPVGEAQWVKNTDTANKSKSCAYAKAAAEQGDPHGLVRLGICYRNGFDEVPKDLQRYAMYCFAAKITAQERLYPAAMTLDLIEPGYAVGQGCAAMTLDPITPAQYEAAEKEALQWIADLKTRTEVRRQAKIRQRVEVCRAKLTALNDVYTQLYAWAAKENINLPPALTLSPQSAKE